MIAVGFCVKEVEYIAALGEGLCHICRSQAAST